jgi:hypothetical protein
MKNSRNIWTAILVCAAAIAITTAVHDAGAGGDSEDKPTKWMYGRLEVQDNKVVFIEAHMLSTIQKPMSPLSGNVSRASRAGSAYTASTQAVRDDAMGAMNLLGSRGWEAIAIMPKEKGYVVLFKYPYPN